MEFLKSIADWFIPVAEQLPFLQPLTEPFTIALIIIVGLVALSYWVTGSWLGSGRRRRDYDDDYYDY